MALEKIVRLVAISACPGCRNPGFDLESGADVDDYEAMVRCGACGYVCPANEFTHASGPPSDD